MDAAGYLRNLSAFHTQIKVLSKVMAPILNQEAGFGDYTYKGQALSTIADNQIVQLIKSGHEDAFPELYHRYSSQIYNYILRLVSNPGIAEELLQEVFVATWQGVNNFKHKSSIKTWLFRIAHYKTMSWMRDFYRSKEVDQDEIEYVDAGRSPDNLIFDNWQVEKIQEALNCLSTNHRSVVELCYFQGLSYVEISEVIGCPVGTVKSRMSYALNNLNGILVNSGVTP